MVERMESQKDTSVPGRLNKAPGSLAPENGDTTQEVRQYIEWARRPTIFLDKDFDNAKKEFNYHSIVIFGKDSETLEPHVAVVAPQISTENLKYLKTAESALVSKGVAAIHWLEEQGKITPQQSQKMRMEMSIGHVGLDYKVQNGNSLAKKSVPQIFSPISKEQPYQTPTLQNTSSVVQEKRGLSRKKLIKSGIIAVGGFSLVGCSVVQAAPLSQEAGVVKVVNNNTAEQKKKAEPTNKTISEPTSEPTKIPTPEPTKVSTPEPTKDAGGNYIPVPEAFWDTGTGKIKEIKDLDEPNSNIEKLVQEVKDKLNIKDDSELQSAYLNIVCENGSRAYMLVRNTVDGKAYAVFVKNENGFYLPPDSTGELALLPLKTVSKEVQMEDGSMDQRGLLGFDVNGSLLIPPTFKYSVALGELTYVDPRTGEQIVLTKETNTAPKMLAMLKGENTVEIKQFKTCSPENYSDCPIDVEDLFNGNYLNWLRTLSKPFDQKSIKSVPMAWYYNGIEGDLIYSIKTAPNFKQGGEPFRRDVTAGYTEYQGHGYIVMPVEYFDINHPDINQWIITVSPLYKDNRDLSKNEGLNRIKVWREKMKITVIRTGVIPLFNTKPDPLVSKTYERYTHMKDLILSFLGNGSPKSQDLSALSKPGIILLGGIAETTDDWYK